jgi:hypothetical protein
MARLGVRIRNTCVQIPKISIVVEQIFIFALSAYPLCDERKTPITFSFRIPLSFSIVSHIFHSDALPFLSDANNQQT